LLKSTSQSWSTIDKNISGTNYHFLIKTLADKTDLIIDSLCVNKRLIKEFHYSVIGKSNIYTNYIKGDSIIVSVNESENGVENKIGCNCIKNYNSYIYYSFKNKKYTLYVDSMLNLPVLK
jgi:hypothetical protein